MPGRRQDDPSLAQEVYDAAKLARQAQAEARAAKADLEKDFEKLSEKVEKLKEDISSKKIGDALDIRNERRERWQSVGSAFGKFVFYVVVIILNWDRAGVFFKDAFHKAERTKVPLMLDTSKKPVRKVQHHKRKPQPPPVITPELKNEETNNEIGTVAQ